MADQTTGRYNPEDSRLGEFSPYRKENTTLHHYKDQLVNAVFGNNRYLH
jgi:hypothetical protein